VDNASKPNGKLAEQGAIGAETGDPEHEDSEDEKDDEGGAAEGGATGGNYNAQLSEIRSYANGL